MAENYSVKQVVEIIKNGSVSERVDVSRRYPILAQVALSLPDFAVDMLNAVKYCNARKIDRYYQDFLNGDIEDEEEDEETTKKSKKVSKKSKKTEDNEDESDEMDDEDDETEDEDEKPVKKSKKAKAKKNKKPEPEDDDDFDFDD